MPGRKMSPAASEDHCSALRGYKDNSRRGYDAQMSEVVYDLKDEDFVESRLISRPAEVTLLSRPAIPPATVRLQRSIAPIR